MISDLNRNTELNPPSAPTDVLFYCIIFMKTTEWRCLGKSTKRARKQAKALNPF